MVFGRGLVSSRVEDVARREASLGSVDMCICSLGKGLFLHVWKMLHVERGLSGFCRHVHMIFGRGLVSSHVEDVARRERLVWVL